MITVIKLTIVLLLMVSSTAEATLFYDTDAETRTCNTSIVNTNIVDGKMWIVYPDPGAKPAPFVRCSLTPPSGSQYYEFLTIAAGIDGNGRCTPANTEALCTHDAGVEIPMTSTSLSLGQPLYLGVFVRYDKISNRDVWLDTTGTQQDSWDKCFEVVGAGFRWGIGCGWPAAILTSTNGKYSWDAWCSPNTFTPCESPGNYLHKSQNANGYTNSNPFLSDYGKWYAVVLEVTLNTTTSGRVRLYINGTAITDVSIITTDPNPTLDHIFLYGTISQPDYDSPDHYIRFDRLMLTDTLSDITNAGLMSDPEVGGGGGSPTSGNSVIVFVEQAFISTISIIQYLMILAFLWEQRRRALQLFVVVSNYYWQVKYRRAVNKWQKNAPIMIEHQGEIIDLDPSKFYKSSVISEKH